MSDTSIDIKRVNAAVRIKIALGRPDTSLYKVSKLQVRLKELKDGMSQEELREYYKRIA